VVQISPDGSTLASAASDGVVLSDLRGGPDRKIAHDIYSATNVAMSPDGATVLVPTKQVETGIFDTKTGTQIKALSMAVGDFTSPSGTVLDFSRDGTRIVIGGGFPGCLIYDPRGALMGSLHAGYLDAVALRPDGRRLVTVASAGSGGLVLVYDLTTPSSERLLGKLEPNHAVAGVTFSPDGSRIATSESDGTLSLWDASSFRRLLVLAGDADGKLVFSPDGKRLAYVARGGVVRVLTLRIDDLIQLAKAHLARSTVKS